MDHITKYKCFVVMPISKELKLWPDERSGLQTLVSSVSEHLEKTKSEPSGAISINFDDVYNYYIKKAVETANQEIRECAEIECVRADELQKSGGMITLRAIREICKSDITITDVTAENPNVYMEHGIRTAVRPSLNLLVAHKGTKLPLYLSSMSCIFYEMDIGKIDEAVIKLTDELTKYVRNDGRSSDDDEFENHYYYYKYIQEYTGAHQERLLSRHFDRRKVASGEALTEILPELLAYFYRDGGDAGLSQRLKNLVMSIGADLETLDKNSALSFYRKIDKLAQMPDSLVIDVWNQIATLAQDLGRQQISDEYNGRVESFYDSEGSE